MKTNIKAMLERQASWQRSRKIMSWADKLRSSLSVRHAAESLRKTSSPLKSGR